MYFIYKGEVVNYEFINNNFSTTILFLHGWGGDKNSFASSINLLKNKFNIITLTLPTIKNTNFVWKLKDYVELVINILNTHNVNSTNIICHSFGFRVACLLSRQFKVNKIVVTGGAGLIRTNPIKSIEVDNKKIFLKKWKFLYNTIASADYKNLSHTNKQTFKNIVNLNTKNYINFNCPILLFWGRKDSETPFNFAKIIAKQNNAKLISTNSGHFAYLEDIAYFNNKVVEFLC